MCYIYLAETHKTIEKSPLNQKDKISTSKKNRQKTQIAFHR